MKSFAVALALTALLAGCQAPLNGRTLAHEETARQVREGMTADQVEAAWGSPASVEKSDGVEEWTFRFDGEEVVSRPTTQYNVNWRPPFGENRLTLLVPYVEERTVRFDANGKVERIDTRKVARS